MQNIFHIPAGVPFLKELARGIHIRWPDFSKVTIFLPNKRSCRSLREILGIDPKILPLGEEYEEVLDSQETTGLRPISPIRRKFLLTQIITEWRSSKEETPDDFSGSFIDHSAYLADHLARFLDEMQREKIPLEKLREIVPAELANHWQVTLDFFSLLEQKWPEILAEKGLIDIAEYTNLLLERQAQAWTKNPPEFPVIIAGSTGSIPATASLIKSAALLSNGNIILPGLDLAADVEYWKNIDETHPQQGLKNLLESMKTERSEIKNWTDAKTDLGRLKFASEIMCPGVEIDKWLSLKIAKNTVDGIERIDCHNQQEEATVIAMRFKEILEEPDATAALVTTDRHLARRVSAIMKRWNVSIFDTAGVRLLELPDAVFLHQCLKAADASFSPVHLLALLKNPLAECGMAGKLERAALRGIRNYNDLDSLQKLLEEKNELELAALILSIAEKGKKFLNLLRGKQADFGALLQAHMDFSGKLSEKLWQGATGRNLKEFLEKLIRISSGTKIDPMVSYPGLFEAFLQTEYYYPETEKHPRISIMGMLEARLQQFDLVIIGGLNEGSWPVASDNPWMSRAMRQALGLFTEEKHKSLSAHDFYSLIAAKKVLLTRAERIGGEVTIPSNLLLRMDALLKAAKMENALQPAKPWRKWAELMYEPSEKIELVPPAPKPPINARPKKLSVTAVERLLRNPYRIYASHILRLKPLPAIDQDPEKAEIGEIVHKAMEIFGQNYRDAGFVDIRAQLTVAGEQAFSRIAGKAAYNFWWPKFASIIGNVARNEIARRKTTNKSFFEINGEITLDDFTLTAKADRIEIADSGGCIVDYKTGALPAIGEIEKGLAVQLFLEALIFQSGGFDKFMIALGGRKAADCTIKELEYWKLFSDEGITIHRVKDVAKHIEQTTQQLKKTIEQYSDPDTPYASTPWLDKGAKHDPYRHLARVGEWLYS